MAILSSKIGRSNSQSSIQQNRVVDAEPLLEELTPRKEDGLRPQCLDDYIGQTALKEVPVKETTEPGARHLTAINLPNKRFIAHK